MMNLLCSNEYGSKNCFMSLNSLIEIRLYTRKIRLTRRFGLFCLLGGGYLFGDKRLPWSGLTVLSSDALSTAAI